MPPIVESPVKMAGKPMVDQQSPDEQKLADMVLSSYKESKSFKKNYDKEWESWYRYYAGQHWQAPVASWKSTPTLNFIFSTIETIVPIMTDSRPQITVVPIEPSDTNISEILQNVIKKIWLDQDMDLKLPLILRNTLKYGTGFAKVWWNPILANGKGDVAISIVDPRHIFPSPGAIEFSDAKYVIFAANIPVSLIERDYPEMRGKIPGGIWDEELSVNKTITSQTGPSGIEQIGPIQSSDGTSTSWPSEFPSGQATMDRKGMATLVEMWHRDENNDILVTIMANGKLLKHGSNPFKHGEIPFIKLVDYAVPSSFWGMGEIQQLHRLQDDINKRRGQIHDILKITGNPPFIADADSGVNPKAMTNRPGTILYKNRGSDVRWLQPPILPSALFSLQELDKRDFDSISGIFDVTQGRRPVGIEAASAIIELQEAAQTRLRLKVRNMEASLRKLGKQVISLVQQFYTEKRVIRIVGKSFGSKPEFVTINAPDLTGASESGIMNDVSVGEFDLEIGTGSTMPVSKTRLFAQMLQLYQAGLVDQRAVLEKSPLSQEESEAIIERMQSQQTQKPGELEELMSEVPQSEQEITSEQEAPPTEEELKEIEESVSESMIGTEGM